MRTIQEIFSQNLKRIRKKEGFKTQTALADALGVAKGTVAAWEDETRLPELGTLIELSHILKVHPKELFADITEPLSIHPKLAILDSLTALSDDESADVWNFMCTLPSLQTRKKSK